jgi:hypothetical protein
MFFYEAKTTFSPYKKTESPKSAGAALGFPMSFLLSSFFKQVGKNRQKKINKKL